MPVTAKQTEKTLNTALHELIASLGIQSKLQEYDAVNRWNEIMGEQIANASEAIGIKQGVLHVHVTTGPWRNELTLRKKEIIEKINTSIGSEIVKDIKFQ
jgi:predicted nucleic acid-binding Zn ribbon protein